MPQPDADLPLTFACGLYDRMQALQTGEVQVEGVDLNFLVDDNPRNIFDRMAHLNDNVTDGSAVHTGADSRAEARL